MLQLQTDREERFREERIGGDPKRKRSPSREAFQEEREKKRQRNDFNEGMNAEKLTPFMLGRSSLFFTNSKFFINSLGLKKKLFVSCNLTLTGFNFFKSLP